MIVAAVCVLVAVRVDAEAEAAPEARVKFKRPGVPAVPKPKLSGPSRKKTPSRNSNININSHRRQGRMTTEPREL